ncbi:MAG: hypothetical protein ACEPOZ_15815 [Marinifilaceae bacterium]|jgi:predicted RNase H-like nuclease (RuvC/YqgF family)
MRKIIIALFILPLFVACNQKELKQLREQNKQLTELTKEKDATINDFVESMNTIEENLAIIKEKQKIIAVNAKEQASKSQKAKIASDITLINDLLEQNKRDLESLNKKLKNSWYQNSKLRKLTDNLKKQLEEKEAEILALNEKVSNLNIEVENLNGKVTELNGTVVALNTENENKAKEIADKTTALNTAYYVIGSSRELQEKKVIVKSGGLLGLGRTSKLHKDFKDSEFNKIDITKTTTIPVTGRKVSLVTSHPSGSYKIEGTDKVEGITILNPEKFWKASKYLVVAVR